MKRAVWIGVFVFSLALNLAVAATLGRHLWSEHHSSASLSSAGTSGLTGEELNRIRNLCLKQNGAAIMDARSKILEKNFQLLDLMAQHPVDAATVEQRFNELVDLKRRSEKDAIDRISNAMAAFPPERRQAFAVFLKNRCCLIPGMGLNHGGAPASREGMVPCPVRTLTEQGTSR